MTVTAGTTLGFTLGDIADEFGYRCRLEFSMNEAILPVEPAITSIVYRPPGMP